MRSYIFLLFYLGLLIPAFAQPFIGAMMWCWIAFMSPHREVWGGLTHQPYALTVFVVTVIACFLAREPKQFPVNAVTVSLIVFAILVTITSFTGMAPSDAIWTKWDRTIKTILGALLVASLLTTRRRIHALIWLMAICIGFYGVKGGAFTFMTGGAFRVNGPSETMIADRNHVAVAMLVAVPLMNYLRMQSAHAWVKTGLLIAMGLTLFAAIGSQSRGALVGLAATAGVLWWRSKNKFTSGVLIAACCAGIIMFMPDSWVERMQTTLDYENEGSAMGRIRIWETSWLLALKSPLVGSGFMGPYQQYIVDTVSPGVEARAVHSIYLEVLGEHGFPAFFAWSAIIVGGAFYAWRLVRMAKGRPDLAWAGDFGRMVQVSMVAYLTGGAFLSLSYWDYFWTLMLVTAAIHTLAVQTLRGEVQVRTSAVGPGWRRGTPQGATT
ncbi:putative O-glycosylation ligase, exosortase A system-associated [Falsiroseomonas oryzae]|uniref:putative O-glycosylation ligase, exosortase A system-associated n=1 Tax=Falsiroseomonas oryzae TaxID=2766473 RepID=UPI0022EB1693|nr:putative O-glycosylation ligase, exosortase A system-associated [Roseomonas sp. MO-31]